MVGMMSLEVGSASVIAKECLMSILVKMPVAEWKKRIIIIDPKAAVQVAQNRTRRTLSWTETRE